MAVTFVLPRLPGLRAIGPILLSKIFSYSTHLLPSCTSLPHGLTEWRHSCCRLAQRRCSPTYWRARRTLSSFANCRMRHLLRGTCSVRTALAETAFRVCFTVHGSHCFLPQLRL